MDSREPDLFERLRNARRQQSDEPVPRLPHLGDPRFSARLIGSPSAEELPEIHVFADVLDELRYRAVWNPEGTSGCILTGGWFLGSIGRYVEIDGFRDASEVTDTLAWAQELRARPDVLKTHWSDDSIVVGWSVVRPGSAAELGPDELLLHNTFFPRLYHVGVMIDPTSGGDGKIGFYIRSDVGVFHNAPFVLLA